MKLASTHVNIVIAAILLVMYSPIVLGQANPRYRSKLQIGNVVQILSPTRGADFSGYTEGLMAKLKRRWIYVMPESFYTGDAGTVDVRLQVRADGTFVNPDPKVERSSGKDALDAAAVDAIRASAPFPHFPGGFDGSTIDIKISFFYNIPVKKPDPIVAPANPNAGAEAPK
jgi:TonB family protein